MAKQNVLAVFGATGTVGHALLEYLLKQDVMGSDIKVVAIGTDEKATKELEGHYKERLTTACCDAKDLKQVQAVLEKHKGEGLLGIVNLIGDYSYAKLTDLSGEDVMAMMQDNLLTSFNILKVGCPMLAEAGGGNITCVGAAVVHYGMKHHEAWAAAKGAVEAMHRSAAATYADRAVRINCVASGLIESPASGEVSQNLELASASAALYPLGRLASADDVAWAAAWLSHPKTTFTTGVLITWLYRGLGTRIGRGCCIGGGWSAEPDALQVGDHAVLETFSAASNHTIERRKLSISRITLGDRCTLGVYAVAFPESAVEAGGLLDHCSVLLGERLAGTWRHLAPARGIPAEPTW